PTSAKIYSKRAEWSAVGARRGQEIAARNLGDRCAPRARGATAVAGSLLNDPTRNPIAGVAGGGGDRVGLLRVNHDRGAAVLEQRIRFALLERDGLVHERQ